MKNILDYLKAKGVDTSKLMGSSKDEDATPSSTDTLPPAPSLLGSPSPINSPAKPGMSPSPSDVDTLNAKLPVSPIPTGPANTDAVPASKGLGDTFAGFPKEYDTVNDLPGDSEDDASDKGGSDKLRRSIAMAGRGRNADHQAMQDALNGGFSNNTVEGLKAAQEKAKSDTNLDSIFRAVGNISGGLAGMGAHSKAPDQTDNNKFYDLQDKAALQGVTDFKDAGEQEKNDPKSAASVNARRVLALAGKSMGFTIPDNMSAAQAELFFPKLSAMSTAKDNREAKSDDLAYKYSMLNEMKKQGQQGNDDKLEQKLSMAEKDDLDPNKARGGNFAKSQSVVNASDRVNALFRQFPDFNIPKSQTVELATATAAMISGGTPQSQQQIEHLIPSSVLADGIDGISRWLGTPKGREQQEFMRMMKDSADREKEVAQGQVLNTQLQRLGAHQVISRRFPDTHSQILSSYGITPEMLAEYKKTGKVPSRNTQDHLTTSSGASSSPSGHSPGDIVSVKDKQYKVGADGDSLDPI